MAAPTEYSDIHWKSTHGHILQGPGLEVPYSKNLVVFTDEDRKALYNVVENVMDNTGLKIHWHAVHAVIRGPVWKFWIEGADQEGNIWGYYHLKDVGYPAFSYVILNQQMLESSFFNQTNETFPPAQIIWLHKYGKMPADKTDKMNKTC